VAVPPVVVAIGSVMSDSFSDPHQADELLEFLGLGLLLLDVLLGGITIGGFAGADVEGYPQPGADVGGCPALALAVEVGQQALGFFSQRLFTVGILAQVGTDKHQGLEMDPGSTALYVVGIVKEQPRQCGSILQTGLGIVLGLHAVLIDRQQFVLDVLHEVIPDGIDIVLVEQCYILRLDIEHLDVHDARDKLYGQVQMQLAPAVAHIHHVCLMAGEDTLLDFHAVFLLDAVDGRAEFEAATVLDAVGIELIHHSIGDLCRLFGGGVYQVAQLYAESLVPLVIHQGADVILLCLEKHDVLKVILGLCNDRLGLGYGHLPSLGLVCDEFLLRLGEWHDLGCLLACFEIVVGIERFYHGIVIVKTLCVLDIQPRLEPFHVQVLHDKPHRLAAEGSGSISVGYGQS